MCDLVSFIPEDFEGDEPSWVEDEKANFDHVLDKNGDGKLDSDEVREWLVPDTETTNQVEMRHLFMSADTNRVSGRTYKNGRGHWWVESWWVKG